MTEVNNDLDMCWIDMETTGLDASLDVPLELGLRVTDPFGKMIAEEKWLINEPSSKQFTQGVLRGHNDDFVRHMHTENGLWKDLKKFETWSRLDVETQAVKWLQELGVEQGKLPLAGSSIGSLDRPFLLVHFPRLNAYLSYRNIDISSVKELCKRNNPKLFEALKPFIGDKEDYAHRVSEDISASINEYLVYCEEYLMVGDEQ